MTRDSRAWDAEYAAQGVPSSVRTKPSGALVGYLKRVAPPAPGCALDIGCGRGRNVRYLAELGWAAVGLDYSDTAVRAARRSGVSCVRADAGAAWPFADDAFDLAVDAFCFKHLIEPSAVAAYARELRRVLRPGGAAMLSLAPPEDGYYGACPREADGSGRVVILDPKVGVRSVLYGEADISEMFGGFSATRIERREKPGDMHGRCYDRVTDVYRLVRF